MLSLERSLSDIRHRPEMPRVEAPPTRTLLATRRQLIGQGGNLRESTAVRLSFDDGTGVRGGADGDSRMRLMLIGWLLVLTIAACSSGGLSQTTSPSAVSSMDGPTQGPLLWERCDDDLSAFDSTECALVTVPLDHDDPSLGTIELPLRRRLAEMPERRIGTLLWVDGGPGARGTEFVLQESFSLSVSTRFDIVGWDPRGTSGSSRLSCMDDWSPVNNPFASLEPDPDTREEADEWREVVGRIADECVSEHGDLVPRVGTYESVRDVDLIRQALGEEEMNLMGASYGSRVAAVYATLFPKGVRAAVLDGYDDPNVTPSDHGVRLAAAFERRLDDVLGDCSSDPACPFHSDGDSAAALDRLLERLEATPLERPIAGGPAVDHGMAFYVLEKYLYDEYGAGRMLEALDEAAGGDGTGLYRLYAEDVEANLAKGITPMVNQAIICADRAGFWESVPTEEKLAYRDRLDDVAPRFGWRFGPNRIDPDAFPVICLLQPLQESRMPRPIDAEGAGPIMVIGATGDVATPYEAALAAVDDLDDGHLVTIEADHHVSYFRAISGGGQAKYRCLLDAVHDYLIDLRVPPEGHTCS